MFKERRRSFAFCLFVLMMNVLWLCRTTAAETHVVIDTQKPKWTISKYLVGIHIVYSSAPDKAFKDGHFAEWVRKSGVSTARFPGGSVVKYWDWKNPTGVLNGDPWAPRWDSTQNRSDEEWMSLDEYLDFVKKTGITPLLGVNAISGKLYDREKESIQRAADMVAYVKKRGFGGAFWYIGNEDCYKYGGVTEYAKVFKKHAIAMKKVDPKIKIFWNYNNPNEKVISTFLKHDGGTSDGLETHGKWPYGGDPKGYAPGNYHEWLTEVPLRDRKNRNRKWRYAAATYRKIAAKYGRKNYLIANNEYGIGKGKNIEGFNRYGLGLLMTDLLQEHFLGNWDMTCFWDTIRGDKNGLMSPPNNYRLNPFHLGMDLLADAQGGKFFDVTTDNKLVYGFASMKADCTFLFLINKTNYSQNLSISFTGHPSFGHVGGRIMQDTMDHWGEIVDLPVQGERPYKTTMPPLSFCQIVFKHLAQ